MKKQLLLAMVLGLSTIGTTFVSCSNDDDGAETTSQAGNNATALQLTIDDAGKTTTTTFSFSITPSDDNISYHYFYVSQAEFAGLTKERLAQKYIHDLQREAEEKGQDFQSYAAGKAVTGRHAETIENLTAGSIYEIIAFALSGTEPAGKVSALYFQTPLVDKTTISFNVTGAWSANGYGLSITPSNDTTPYYVGLVTKADYEQYKQQFTDDEILTGLLGSEINNQNPSSEEELIAAYNKLVMKGKQVLTYKGVTEGMNIVWIAGGAELVNGNTELATTTNVTTGELTVPAKTTATRTTANSYVVRDLKANGCLVLTQTLKK